MNHSCQNWNILNFWHWDLFLVIFFYNSIQFNSAYSHLYKIFTLYKVRYEYNNKEEEQEQKRNLMALMEVYGGQRSLAFGLTTAIL